MNVKAIATLAATLVAASAWAAKPMDQKCGAGTCGKKEATCKPGDTCDNSTSKKDASCSKKEASCAKK